MIKLKRHSWLSLFFLLDFLCCSLNVQSQGLYYKAYGEKGRPVLVYIHGGPRGNATLFEGTTAEKLAQQGFYVVAYDRRGEGRSLDTGATFTFREAIDDLSRLIDQQQLGRVNLLAHSFGGIVATLFANQHPQKVEKLILVGALVNQQQTYDHILSSVGLLAKKSDDTAALEKLRHTISLDRNTAAYRKLCYELAADYGFFRMPRPTESYRILNDDYQNGKFGRTNIRNDRAPLLFYQNERRVNLDNLPLLKEMVGKGQRVYAIYGADDRIFSEAQIDDIRSLVGKDHFISIDNCSHYPFVDQQEEFIVAVKRFMGK
jgi:proline iminopeptidase